MARSEAANPENPAAMISQLGRQIRGTVLEPAHADYEDARRVWNGMIDRRPAVVVRAASPDDIAPVLRFARENSLPLAVRGGGHGVAGHGTVEAGLVLDLGALDSVTVDAGARTVTAQAGAKLADVDRATAAYGLAVPLGVVSGTGIAGLTLGGGVGWLTRPYGLTIDNLLSADLVTADGNQVRASETENPELFWGIRGGGGNFGVAASFTYRAHPLPADVYSGNLVYGRERWAGALRAYETWTRGLPDALTSILTFMVPPAEWELGDEPLLLVGFDWADPDREAGARVLAPLLQAAPPDVQAIEPAAWVSRQSAADAAFPKGVRAYWKNTSFDRLDDGVIEVLIRRGSEQTWRGTGFDVHHLGGAFGRVPAEATAFPNRSARFWLNIYGFWNDVEHDAAHTAFVRGFAADMEPFASGGQYVNFMGLEEAGAPASSAYAGDALRRLRDLKRRYDPENLFRLNHNIPPG